MSYISAVTLVVPSYEEGIAFFVGKLGFILLEDTILGNGKRWVRVQPKDDGVNLLLAKAEGNKQTAAIGNQTGGRVGFFLQTANFDGDFAKFQQAGVEFLEKPRSEPYGKVAVFQDTFGNKWDLIQPNSIS